jgi:hypothetical protein
MFATIGISLKNAGKQAYMYSVVMLLQNWHIPAYLLGAVSIIGESMMSYIAILAVW